MKQWSKDDLVLFYYGELTQEQNEALREAMTKSTELRQDYAELCDFLDNDAPLEVPQPTDNLEQQIMAALYQQADANARNDVITPPKKFSLWQAAIEFFNLRLLATTLAMSFVVVGVFYLGRWSSQVEKVPEYVEERSSESQAIPSDGEQLARQSRRVLFSNVSSHIEKSNRLFRLVSNGNGDLAKQIESRRQTIEELVALNRLYRRVAQASGDRQLENVLQQMESILVELNHTSPQAQPDDLESLKQRVDDSDLIYRLKVTNKKLAKKII